MDHCTHIPVDLKGLPPPPPQVRELSSAKESFIHHSPKHSRSGSGLNFCLVLCSGCILFLQFLLQVPLSINNLKQGYLPSQGRSHLTGETNHSSLPLLNASYVFSAAAMNVLMVLHIFHHRELHCLLGCIIKDFMPLAELLAYSFTQGPWQNKYVLICVVSTDLCLSFTELGPLLQTLG